MIVPASRRRRGGSRAAASIKQREEDASCYRDATLSVAPVSLAAFDFAFCPGTPICGKGLADIVAFLELAT